MTAASLYHHFSNKQDILRSILVLTLQDVLAVTRVAVLRSGGSPAGQLSALTAAWVEFHAEHRVPALVSAAEMRYLDAADRSVVVALRDEQELMFRQVVEHGVETGAFGTPDPHHATRAIINMGTAVSSWFRPDGSLTVGEVGLVYARLALALVEARRA